MTHVDQQVNRLVEELEHYGIRDETYICFVSDHGEMLGDHLLFRKGFPYEGSARIPMLINGPGIPRGVVDDRLVELRDVMPTLLDCAGLPVPESVEGRSFLPLARGQEVGWRTLLHGEHAMLGQSFQWFTDGREKYVWLSRDGHEQLFDLVADPEERCDLARRPDHADRLARWQSLLITELAGREEGFTDGHRLIPGRPVRATLRSPGAPVPD